MSGIVYNVRLLEKDAKRHVYLGSKSLTRLVIHAVQFSSMETARDAASWMLQNNPGVIVSAQIVVNGRTVEKVAA